MSGGVSSLKSALAAAKSALSSIQSPDELSAEERIQLTMELKELSAAIAPPEVAIQKLCWGHHGLTAAKVALGMGVFRAFAAEKNRPLTLAEIKPYIKGDVELLARIMRMISAYEVVREVGQDKWEPRPLAVAFGAGAPPVGFLDLAYFELKAAGGLYEYFESTGFKNPDDAFAGPFQSTLRTKDHFLTFLDNYKDQRVKQGFNMMMIAQGGLRGQEWYDFYPVEKLATSEDKTLLVDIGGNLGHDASRLRQRFPHMPGRIVVQDLPSVIRRIEEPLPQGLEAMEHDMFSPQPVKGAKAYYFRTVLHDWPDKQALQALGHVRDAMAPDSVLLVNDNIVPEVNSPPVVANVDFFMLNLWGAKERTQKQWETLLHSAGFKILRVWRPTQQGLGTFGVFEAVPA